MFRWLKFFPQWKNSSALCRQGSYILHFLKSIFILLHTFSWKISLKTSVKRCLEIWYYLKQFFCSSIGNFFVSKVISSHRSADLISSSRRAYVIIRQYFWSYVMPFVIQLVEFSLIVKNSWNMIFIYWLLRRRKSILVKRQIRNNLWLRAKRPAQQLLPTMGYPSRDHFSMNHTDVQLERCLRFWIQWLDQKGFAWPICSPTRRQEFIANFNVFLLSTQAPE